MSYGLRVANGDGYDQIDSEYATYYLQAQGTQVSAFPLENGGWRDAVVLPENLSFDECLFFARVPADGATILQRGIDGRVAPVQVQLGGATQWDLPYEWRVYGPNMVIDGDTNAFGMKVFDPSGTLLFDSRSKFLRLAHYSVLEVHRDQPPHQITGFDRNDWVCLSGTGRTTGYSRISGSTWYMAYASAFRSIDNSLYMVSTPTGTQTVGPIFRPDGIPTPILIMKDYM